MREAFIKLKENKHVLGPMMIKGVGGVKDDEEEEINSADLTVEQVRKFRHVLITQNREKELDNMRKLILGKQADSDFLMFNTSFSYQVLGSWNIVKRSLAGMEDPSKKLDRLFAYTYNLSDLNAWMRDNEGGMDKLVDGLASAWSLLLNSHSDEELGWDCKYTKPGMLELLNQFQNKIEGMPDYFNLGKFKYQ